MIPDLEKVISNCQQNDRVAQEQLYKHFYRYAMSICMLYSRSKFEAEEITNDGFIKVFRKIKDYNRKYPLESWIRKIMINTSIDHFRANKKHYNTLDISEAYETSNNEIGVLEEMAVNDIMKCVQKLSPAYRIVFTLASIEGYKHEEISKQLGISEGASKSNLAKAKANLRKYILSNVS